MNRGAVTHDDVCEGDVSAGSSPDLRAAVYGDRYIAELGGDGDAVGADRYDIAEDPFAGKLARIYGLEGSRGLVTIVVG